ncbi:MAG: Gfo/Idh/MocA family protein [Anaerobacillus sp.]|uniref:Gfo/Idh/MocA family protein n=1 Tax=Anaerobacillus sp. TaxID=1872506 RepID=UPI00391A67E0
MALRIGVVGTGWFSKMHASLLSKMDDVHVQAFCGSSKEKAEKFASSFSGAKGYGNLNEMLDKEQIDAVYICVPPLVHGEIEKMLIEYGIPFLVEKPIGNDIAIPNSILAEVKKKSLITSVGYHFRYKPSVQLLKQKLENQSLGMISGYWMGEMPQVGWWRKQECSGGQFIEQTTHIVDLLRYVAGEVVEVYAAYGNRVCQNLYEEVSVHDVGTVTMKLKSGVVATISNTCILPKGVWQMNMAFFTDQGVMTWEPDRLTITESSGKKVEELNSSNPYLQESEAFLYAVRTGDRSKILSDYNDAFLTQTITCQALESANTGLPIKINS